jgi:hypothetical protein
LQINVIQKYFACNTTWKELLQVSQVNMSVMQHLTLEGDYFADAPLILPSLFTLTLIGTLSPAPNLTLANIPRFSGMVELKDTYYTLVEGGTYDASSLPFVNGSEGYGAVAIVGGGYHSVRGIRALANNTGAAIAVNKSPHTEISFCDVGGDPTTSGVMMQGRCTVRVYRQRFTLEDAIEFHAFAPLEARPCM